MLAAVGLAAARLLTLAGGRSQAVEVSTRHAAALTRGFLDQELDGQVLDPDPTARLPLAGCHPAADGVWIQLYAVLGPHRALAARVLGCRPDADAAAVARVVSRRTSAELLDVLHEAGVPAAPVLTAEQWRAHPQGAALLDMPLIEITQIASGRPVPVSVTGGPTSGIRVLDLSRIIAGPVCGRTLAEHGAEVLHLTIDGDHVVRRAFMDANAGKACALVDRARAASMTRALSPQADVLIQSARPGGLDRRGLGPAALSVGHRGLIYVSVDCFGRRGPWGDHRGFEALVQACSGWSSEHAVNGEPRLVAGLPCDYLTGYLAALGVLEALARRAIIGGSWHVHVSLASTALWLRGEGPQDTVGEPLDTGVRATGDLRISVPSQFGLLRPLRPAPALVDTPPAWPRPPAPPGSAPPRFTR